MWVFGGRRSNDSADPPASLRDAFLRHTLQLPPKTHPWLRELSTPEDFTHWWAFSGYKDLLTFERDACHLAQAVILFVESPGAFAELGAIASNDSLVSHLFAVVEDKHAETSSFLALGPLTRVQRLGARSITANFQAGQHPTSDSLDSICEHFTEWLSLPPHKSKLDILCETHRMLLLSTLVDILIVSKINELIKALQHFHVNISEERVKEILSLLHFFDIIRKVERGHETFYIRSYKNQSAYVDFSGNEKPFDRIRFKTIRQQFIDSHKRYSFILKDAK